MVLTACFQSSQGATLVALWEFEGNWQCTSNNTYNFTPYGPALLTNSQRGVVADFHGGFRTEYDSPDLARVETGAQPTSAEFNSGLSVMAWIYPRGTNAANVLSHDRTAVAPSEWGFQAIVSDRASVWLRDTNDRRIIGDSPADSIHTGQWQHVAWVWNGDINGGFNFYTNGVSVPVEFSRNGQPGSFIGLDSTLPLTVRVGAHHGDSEQGSTSFDGLVDHLSLWHGTLTPAEVLADYQASIVTPVPTARIVKAVRLEMQQLAVGTNYQIQTSSDLASWVNYGVPFVATTTNAMLPCIEASAQSSFWRLKSVP